MTVTKEDRTYTIQENGASWRVIRDLGKVKATYHVSKELAPDEDALRRYILQEKQF